MSTSIKITRKNGGIKPVAANNDGLSGLVCYIPATDIPAVMTEVKKISTLEEAEALGFSDDKQTYKGVIYYHLREAFRLNPSLVVYLGVYSNENIDYSKIKEVTNVAKGELRQVIVFDPTTELVKTTVTSLQQEATSLESDDKPLSIVYCPKVSDCQLIPDIATDGYRNVSVSVGEDLDSDSIAEDYRREDLVVTMAGVILGILSLAKVSESIAWVKKFNTGMGVAGLVDGTKYINMTKTQISDLEAKRVLFAKTYVGYDGVYMNDSYTMDIAKSDYNAIERMRTMDKAARGVRAYLLPYVAGNVEIDASTGQIAKDSIEVMKNEGNRFLEQMERDGELSGCSVEIDSNQNVLATSTIKVVIQNVPMGVSRNISIEMGYAESV